jgi:hypothetical protein
MNRTIALAIPLPCAKAAGLAKSALKSIAGALTVRLELAVPLPLPSAWPFPEKEADDLEGPLAAFAAAERTAERRAVGLAPRTVSTTDVPFRIRNVGILSHHSQNPRISLQLYSFFGTHAEMPYVPATSR